MAHGGCIFCSNKGSGELIKSAPDISSQVTQYFESYRAKRANKFIAYFQNFTNTYDTIQNLKEKYDSALIDDRIVGLDIATRPDCINENVAKLISSYMPKYKVFVELGLQTSNDSTGSLINRGYDSSKFTEAVSILNKYTIPVICHIMVGLPTESTMISVQENIDGKTYNFKVFKDVIETIKFINTHNISGIKIHSTYIVKNTKLSNMYENGEYTPITYDEYLENLVYIITHINPKVIVHRISADPPKDLLVAPEWCLHKKWVTNNIDKLLEDFQGADIKVPDNLDEKLNVLVVSKSNLKNTNTYLAQGGISTARNNNDIELFIEDTLKAGQHKNKIDSVDGLLKFNMEGYTYNDELSNGEVITFTRKNI